MSKEEKIPVIRDVAIKLLEMLLDEPITKQDKGKIPNHKL